jgi:LacI family transcriptional regulator
MPGGIALVLNSGLFNSLSTTIFQSMFHGIAKEAQKIGASVIILHSDRWRTEFPAGLFKLPLRGVVLIGASFRPNVLKQYEDLKVPVVLLDRPGDEWNLNSITVDNYRAAHDAASRIIALGHRNIALIRYINKDMQMVDPDDRERIAGFRAACASDSTKSVHVKLFSVMNPHLDSTIQEIFDSKPRFTAVFTSFTSYAHRLAMAAEKARIHVPRVLSIVTFSSADSSIRNWSGPQINFFDMAQQAVKLITRKPGTTSHIRIPTTWNPGTTVSAPASRGRS